MEKKYRPDKHKLSIFSIITSHPTNTDPIEVEAINQIIADHEQNLQCEEPASIIFGQPTHNISLKTELADYGFCTYYLRVTANDTITPHSLFPFDDTYDQSTAIPTAIKDHLEKLSYVRTVLSKKEYDALSNQN